MSQNIKRNAQQWTGSWFVGVAVLHTLASFVLFRSAYIEIVSNGFFGAAQTPTHKLAAWFIISGFFMLVIGICLRHLPKVPISIGLILLSTATLGIFLMPLSGFWLLLPPSLAIIKAGL